MNNLSVNTFKDIKSIISKLENTMKPELNVTNANKRPVPFIVCNAIYKDNDDINLKQALAIGTVFKANLESIINGNQDEWLNDMDIQVTHASVNGEDCCLDINRVYKLLESANMIVSTDEGYELGESIIRVLSMESGASKPTKVGEVFTRKHGYSKVNHGKFTEQCVHVLEDTKYTVNTEMLELARKVFKQGNSKVKAKINTEMYMLKGCGELDPNSAYYSEFKMDNRGRFYQCDYAGPNGQTSDLSRSVQDLSGVSTDYDIDKTIEYLLEEIGEMCKLSGDMLDKAIQAAVNDDVKFILRNIDGSRSIKKPWEFVKVAKIITKLRNGERIYIGVAIGYDAKGSGIQLGALMVSDESMLMSCGFTTKEVDDVYVRGVKSLERAGIKNMTRNGIKKAFMSIFYGAGAGAMMVEKTVLNIDDCFDNMWLDIDKENEYLCGERAKTIHAAITNSFGQKLIRLRAAIKNAGYSYKNKEAKYDKPLKHMMPNGFEVAMDYKICIDINGEIIENDGIDVHVESLGINQYYEKYSHTTDEYDYIAYGRKGFVNMVQGVDAVLASLIIHNCNKLGAKHVICVHDCFRVNVNDVDILEKAIKLTYLELFGHMNNEPTENLNNLDILSQYFIGSQIASKDEYKHLDQTQNQFFPGNDKRRILSKVDGIKIIDVINDFDNTAYFGK